MPIKKWPSCTFLIRLPGQPTSGEKTSFLLPPRRPLNYRDGSFVFCGFTGPCGGKSWWEKQEMEIWSIDRTEEERSGFPSYRWRVRLEGHGEHMTRFIEFNATGFTQELTGDESVVERPVLTRSQRDALKGKRRTTA